jgi:hypothetical protein
VAVNVETVDPSASLIGRATLGTTPRTRTFKPSAELSSKDKLLGPRDAMNRLVIDKENLQKNT